ncbi:NB-ARC domain-containing protein, partial [Aliarcobacter butzleri]
VIKNNSTNISDDFNISKDLNTFVGRKHDIRNVVRDILNIKGKNRVYTVLASGGIGKTTLVKKIANDFSLRGYFKDGYYFVDCEHLKDYGDFEEKIKILFQMNNVINFLEQLQQVSEKERFIVLDNFETLLHLTLPEDIKKIKNFIFDLTNYSTIILTSREKINEDYEEVYTLNYLSIDEAFDLYVSINNININEKEKKYLRDEILENTLNKNPLAIKLVAKLKLNVYDLHEELTKDLFSATDETEKEVIESVFSKESDLNIEKGKSLFYSISLSFEKLKEKHKLMIELLSLFPDGIHKKNFINFYNQKEQKFKFHKIDFKDINILEDKSLIIVNKEFIKLQSIIGRFAEYKFSKRTKEEQEEYFNRAFQYNNFLLNEIIMDLKFEKHGLSIDLFNKNKNNFIKSLDYILYLFNKDDNTLLVEYINYLVTELSFNTYDYKILNKLEYIQSNIEDESLKKFFRNCVLDLEYFYGNFEESFEMIKKEFSLEELFKYDEKNIIEVNIFYKISNIYDMEGYFYQLIKKIINEIKSFEKAFSWREFYFLGCFNLCSKLVEHKYFRTILTYVYFEYMLNKNLLNIDELIKYKKSLRKSEIIEYTQTIYILFKTDENRVSLKEIKELIIANDFTDGLKLLMIAMKNKDKLEKVLFEKAIKKLYHIKYYYVEAILFYSKYLKINNDKEYEIWLEKGKELATKFQYRFLIHNFYCLENNLEKIYNENDYPFPDRIDWSSFYEKYNIKL